MKLALKQLSNRAWHRFYTLFPWLDTPRLRQVHAAYEKAGAVVRDEPIPWNADAVLIEAEVRLPLRQGTTKNDFFIEVPGEPPLLPIGQQTVDGHDEVVRILFRMPVPLRRCRVALFWRSTLLEQISIQTLSREEFLANLRMESATVFARLGEQNVPCEAIVEGQCQQVTAAVVLKSATSLLPILDLRPALEVTLLRSRQTHVLPVSLTSSQLTSREAMVNLTLPARLRAEGGALLHWTVSGQSYAQSGLRTVSPETFRQSLFSVDCRYVYCDTQGALSFSRYLFLQEGVIGLGPCFLVASREPGLAAVHPLHVRVQYKDADHLPEYLEQDVLITDGPSLFIPMTTSPEHFQRISCFDLFNEGEHLGQLSLCTRDVATFTSEGGFTAPEEYPWTPVAEEELADHLRKLMEVPNPLESGS